VLNELVYMLIIVTNCGGGVATSLGVFMLRVVEIEQTVVTLVEMEVG